MHNKKLNFYKTVITLIAVNVLQILGLISLMIYGKSSLTQGIGHCKKIEIVFFLILIIILINSIITIKNKYQFIHIISQNKMQSESFIRIENLNNTLRAQRHDFLNNLQVVYSLMELDEYEDAKEYIEKVYGDIKKVSRILKTSKPAVNALLQAKVIDCENKGINIKLKISTPLKELKISSWELCRVLSNLIDNAIYELNKIKKEGNLLEIEIYEELNMHVFKVKNNGSKISEDIKEKIFHPCFTTKGSEGQGMGLAITKKIIEENKGSIEVCSEDKLTQFIVKIPIS